MSATDQGGGHIQSTSLVFSTLAHNIESVKKAAYRFCDVAAFDFDVSGDSITCTINFLRAQSEDRCRDIVNDFKIEVLDQGLRSAIAQETSALRNAILALTFSKTGLQGGE